MPKTEDDPLGRRFDTRLRAELDRVQPRWSSPRYLAPARIRAWRLAPAALAVALTGLLGITAYAATGSANPAVWTERVVTVIHPALPSSTPESTQPPIVPRAGPPVAPIHAATPEPTEKAEPTEQPEPTNRPEPSDSPEPRGSPGPPGDHSGSNSNRGFPTPTPTPGDH
jgi:hypothetical protein